MIESVMDVAPGPWATLVVGLLTYAGACGAGALVLRAGRISVTPEYRAASAPILGLATVSLLVEWLAMAHLTSRPVLIGLWIVIALLGAVVIVKTVWRPGWRPTPLSSPLATTFLVLAGVAMLAAVVAAIAPSSKIDETYYHMLVPRRIVEDGGLRFYRAPIEAAVLPQMLFQIGMAPLHALGVPDAANVVSLALAVTLLLFAWRLVSREQGDVRVAAACVLVLACAPYVSVWETTGGSHAFGDLAMVLAVTLMARIGRLENAEERAGATALVATLAMCAAAAKLSMWPAATAVTVFAAWQAARGAVPIGRLALIAIAPWLIDMGPIVVWTWLQSGSPFGPALTGIFGSTVYALGETPPIFAAMRAENSWQRPQLFVLATMYSPALWIGALAGVRSPRLDRATRTALTLLGGGQLALVIGFLPHDARFLGGIHFALFIVACASLSAKAGERLYDSRWRTAILAATVPWVGISWYFAGRMVPVVVGAQSRAAYMDSFIALARDFRALDSILPRDASLMVTGERIPSMYAPRRVYFDERDLRADEKVYLLIVGSPALAGDLATLRPGKLVYADSSAIRRIYRTLGRPPDRAPVFAYEAERVSRPTNSSPVGAPRPPDR